MLKNYNIIIYVILIHIMKNNEGPVSESTNTTSGFTELCEFVTLYGKKITIKNENIKAYSPKPVELLWDMYEKIKLLYEVPLSPTIIYKVMNKRTRKILALKQLRKSKLKETFLHEFAKNEILIHYSMSSISNLIVNAENYFEDSENYYIVMEYCKNHGYFEKLLEEVSIFILKY